MKVEIVGQGSNWTNVQIGETTICFSYKTPIAFYGRKGGRVVRKNAWGPTTGKHLNAIDDGNKAKRVSEKEFERLLNEELSQV